MSDEAEKPTANSIPEGKRLMPVGKPFVKGISGNPGGRPKAVADVQALARLHTVAALQALVEALGKPATAVEAAKALLDRGYGKPSQHQILTGADNGPIQTQTVEVDPRPALGAFLTQFEEAKRVVETKH